jgi:hypothetical protein
MSRRLALCACLLLVGCSAKVEPQAAPADASHGSQAQTSGSGSASGDAGEHGEAASASSSDGGEDARVVEATTAPACDAKSEYELLEYNCHTGEVPVCNPVPASCAANVTCSCILASQGWNPTSWPCQVKESGLVEVEEEANSCP